LSSLVIVAPLSCGVPIAEKSRSGVVAQPAKRAEKAAAAASRTKDPTIT
jgi:hypothetical protein